LLISCTLNVGEETPKEDKSKEILTYIMDKKGVVNDKLIYILVANYFSYYNYDSSTKKDFPNSVGRYIVSEFTKNPSSVLKTIESTGYYYGEYVIELLVKEKAKECASHIQDILNIVGLHKDIMSELLKADTKTALEHIKTALQKETNEDTRDAMLQVVASKSRKKKYTEAEVQEIIQNTDDLKRLEKPVREWLKEKDLPELYWQNSKKLTEKEVRFILYRQSREKTMRPDPELKPVLTHIDKSKSGKFAKAVLECFTKGKMDSKDKFCLSIAGLLGDDSSEIMMEIKRLQNLASNENEQNEEQTE